MSIRVIYFLRLSTFVLFISILSSLVTYYFIKETTVPLVHKLETPLLFNGAGVPGHQYVLPAGTSLYFDQAFPEGFVRFKVYFNVEGVRLESHESTDKFWLEPLTAFPIGKIELQKLLATYPLTKDELTTILKSSSLSKEDIRALLTEYSQ